MSRYEGATEVCEFCGFPVPPDRTRYRIRQCCQRAHDLDERRERRGAAGFTATEFLARVTELAKQADELLEETASNVEPSPDLGCALGALAAASKVLAMLRDCGEPDGWKPILPCSECGGTVQHKVGCSHD